MNVECFVIRLPTAFEGINAEMFERFVKQRRGVFRNHTAREARPRVPPPPHPHTLPKEMIEIAKKCPEHLQAAFISKHL